MLALDNGQLKVRVSPKGGALVLGETAAGQPFLRGLTGPFDVLHSACFPLVPLGNRVGSNRIAFGENRLDFRANTADPLYLHGDGWLADWTPDSANATEVRLRFEHPAPAHSPHIYRAEQEIRLDGAALHLTLKVCNLGAAPMPFGLGFHPYFPRAGAMLEFQAQGWWQEGAGHLPVARQTMPKAVDFACARPLPARWMNNAYDGWRGDAVIRWPGLRLTLRADPVFSVLMLYAPDDDDSFFCLEPMSHLPDACNIGQPMQVLAPGETLSGGISFTVVEQENP